ncbi:MAG: hypothetical protein WBM75_21545 [Polyangiales bacterium]
MPPQNLVDRTIGEVSALRVKLAYPMLHLLYVLLATARSSLKPQRELALENLASSHFAGAVGPAIRSTSLNQND